MGNDVRIRVTATDDTKGVRDIIRNGFGVTGKKAADDFAGSFSGTLDEELKKAAEEGSKEFGKKLDDGLGVAGKKAADDFAGSFSGTLDDELKKAAENGSKEFGKKLEDGAEQAGDKAGRTAGKKFNSGAKDEMSAKALAITFGIGAGLDLAGALAGEAVAGGFALGLAGLVVLVAAQNDQVKAKFHELTADVKSTSKQWSDSLAGPVSNAIGIVRSDFDKLAPSVQRSMSNVAPSLGILAHAVDDLALDAMPGLEKASGRLTPVFVGIDSLTSQTGAAIGDLAAEVTNHSGSIGRDFTVVGTIVQSLVHTVGGLTGELSDDFARHGSELTGAVDAIGSTLTKVGSGAFPAFGNAIGGDLQVLTAFLSVLGPADQLLGTFGATALSTYTNVRLFSALQKPVEGLATKLQSAGTEGSTFSNVTTKVGNGLSSMGKALPLVGAGLSVIGMAMELDSQHGEDLAKTTDDIAKGLLAGGTQASDARSKMASLMTESANATNQLQRLEAQTKTTGDQTSEYGLKAGGSASEIGGLSQKIADNKKILADSTAEYNRLAAQLGITGMTADQLSGKTTVYASSAQSATSNTAQLAAQALILSGNLSTADQRIGAIQTSLALLSDQGLEKADDWLDKFGSSLNTFTTSMDAAKGRVFDMSGNLDAMSEKGRDVRKAIEDGRNAMIGYAQSAADAGVPQDQINGKLGVMADQLLGTIGPAVGSKGAAQDLLNTYGALPKNIMTYIKADTSQAQGMVNSFIQLNNGRQVQIYVSALGSGGIASAGRLAHGGVMGAAASGKVLGGGYTWVGEQGAELVKNSPGSTVIPHSNSESIMEKMMAANSGGGSSSMEMSFSGNTDSAVGTLIMRLIRDGLIQIRPQYVR